MGKSPINRWLSSKPRVITRLKSLVAMAHGSQVAWHWWAVGRGPGRGARRTWGSSSWTSYAELGFAILRQLNENKTTSTEKISIDFSNGEIFTKPSSPDRSPDLTQLATLGCRSATPRAVLRCTTWWTFVEKFGVRNPGYQGGWYGLMWLCNVLCGLIWF